MHKMWITYFLVQGVSDWFPQKKITATEASSRRTETTIEGRKEAIETWSMCSSIKIIVYILCIVSEYPVTYFSLQARESFKKLVVSQRPVPEVENLVSENYELENHSVSIVELSASDLAEKNNWIGINKVAA